MSPKSLTFAWVRAIFRAMRRTGGFVAAFGAAGLLATCAGWRGGEPAPLFWPKPPDKPRIVFEGSLRGESDLKAGRRFRWILNTLRIGGEFGWRMREPVSLAVSDSGALLSVVDYHRRRVALFDFQERALRVIGPRRLFGKPIGVALGPADTVIVADQANRRLLFFDNRGRFLRTVSIVEVERPVGIAVDRVRGRIYVVDGSTADSINHLVTVYDLHGRYVGKIGEGRGKGEGRLFFPTYVAVDEGGRVYVADTMNSRVACFEPDGAFVRAYGGPGAGPATFERPKGIAFDARGNMHVVDSGRASVSVWDKKGQFLFSFGASGQTPGSLANPTAIAIDKGGKVYVADTFNFRVNIYRLLATAGGETLPGETRREGEAGRLSVRRRR